MAELSIEWNDGVEDVLNAISCQHVGLFQSGMERLIVDGRHVSKKVIVYAPNGGLISLFYAGALPRHRRRVGFSVA